MRPTEQKIGPKTTTRYACVTLKRRTDIDSKCINQNGGRQRTLIDMMGRDRAHWAIMLVGFICGIPVFFQVGFVLLIPLVFCVAMEARMSLVKIGIPIVAGLFAVHCIVPPHPAAAITILLKADMGKVIMSGLFCGFPVDAPHW